MFLRYRVCQKRRNDRPTATSEFRRVPSRDPAYAELHPTAAAPANRAHAEFMPDARHALEFMGSSPLFSNSGDRKSSNGE